jgi:hypothetical protein
MESDAPLYGHPAESLARLTGRHMTTARRWKNLRRVPLWLATLVRVCLDGDLGPISATWRGWTVRGRHLVSPEGWEFTPGDVRSVPFLHAQVAAYQQRQRTALQADWVEERYVDPEELSAAA